MTMNPLTKAALKALSYKDINVKKNYKLVRGAVNVLHRHFFKPFYKTWDYKIQNKEHIIPVRIFSPKDEGIYPVLLFFHGGGWVSGNIDSYNKVCTNMSKRTKSVVISVDYRLAPEHPFPAAVEDCYIATKEVFANIHLFGVTIEDITLIGDSAGGNLAAAVCLMARDYGEFLPKNQILIYPVTYNDHGDSSPFPSIHENGTDYFLTSKRIRDYLDLYMSGPEDLQNPYFAPLLASDFANQPKTLIITAEYDPLRDEGEAYGRKLEEAGNEVQIYRVKDALHGFFVLSPKFSQVSTSYELINQFLLEVGQ